MSALEYELVTGSRVDTSLLYIKSEMQLYKCNAKLKKSVIYLCTDRNCKSRVRIMKQSRECFRHNNHEHSHPNHESKYKEMKVLNTIKQKCSRLTDLLLGSKFLTVRDVFDTVLSE